MERSTDTDPDRDPDRIAQRILGLARRHFRLPEGALAPQDDLFRSLGIDSVEALDLLSLLERELGVEIPDWELLDVRTFRDLAARVAERL